MRAQGQIKCGYFPLPVSQGPLLRSLLAFPNEPTSVLDPCAGTGAALQALTADTTARLYAIELDGFRALEARERGIQTIQGNIFDVKARVEKLGLLYLNPPYDWESGPAVSTRMEQVFLSYTYNWLRPKGILLMVIPCGVVHRLLDTLVSRFRDIRMFRLAGHESEQYDQVALFGVRHNNNGREAEVLRSRLVRMLRYTQEMPVLVEDMGICYNVPPSDEALLTYTGIPLDLVEDLLDHSAVWKYAAPLLLPKQEAAGGRPLTPLHGGHVGLLATAGQLNGVFGEGARRHIARWRPVKHTSVTTTVEDGVEITRTRERFSNELSLIFATGRIDHLTETSKASTTNTGDVVPADDTAGPDAPAITDGGVPKGLFRLGTQVMTIGVRELIEQGRLNVFSLMSRHVRGDWGDVSPEQYAENDSALASSEGRLHSSYDIGTPNDVRTVWIITEDDRSATTVLLPSEY